MALVSVNATETGWTDRPHLLAVLKNLPRDAPVVIMIHGYRFSPWVADEDPHRHILSAKPCKSCWKAVSWPRHLRLDQDDGALGIGFGWHARGPLPRVARSAFRIGKTLAGLIHEINHLRDDLRVHILAHSLGARVALAALADVPPGALRRIILLSGAEYGANAWAAMTKAGGNHPDIINVTSGENALFDALFRLGVPPPMRGDRPISAGFGDLAGWTDLRIDCRATRGLLRDAGYPTRPPRTRICHWSTYLRPGLFRLYRDLCDPLGSDPLPRLAAHMSNRLEQPSRTGATGGRTALLSPL
ncbi:hypothetical protein [Roseicyclus marinus]|uniref:hypothetical protein n=1 Tax=Roseicyclus marinus TaxID=2161673 RepID=UPI00240F5C6E|nr:hypothetical protein [Roseicyclus marinus]MDG3042379.1 hypothetical protein [Roseicyclus marinus]